MSDCITGILGIGWIDGQEYGQVRTGARTAYADDPGLAGLWQDKAVFEHPVKNYGRFSIASKLACCACALALRDADRPEAASNRSTVGILGTSPDACLTANLSYFKDYIDCGRTLARGNLFIYTLPSSPLAESAIHLGLTGPTFYIACTRQTPRPLFDAAARMIAHGDAEAMLAVLSNDTEAAAFAVGRPAADADEVCGLDTALTVMENTHCAHIRTLVNRFSDP